MCERVLINTHAHTHTRLHTLHSFFSSRRRLHRLACWITTDSLTVQTNTYTKTTQTIPSYTVRSTQALCNILYPHDYYYNRCWGVLLEGPWPKQRFVSAYLLPGALVIPEITWNTTLRLCQHNTLTRPDVSGTDSLLSEQNIFIIHVCPVLKGKHIISVALSK